MGNSEPKKRGGARPGAGRKRDERPRKSYTLTITEKALAKLKSYAATRGISANAAATEIFESLPDN